MHGTGLLDRGGEPVYVYYTIDAGGLRLRVSVDEADRLSLMEGVKVRLRLPGREPADVLITAVVRVPPFVWLESTALVPSLISRAG